MNFREMTLARLARYKEQKLGIKASGEWNGREYPHILPESEKMRNLLPACRNVFNETMLARITLHKGFHHLNSSQAMCMNFFAPILKSDALNFILPETLSKEGYKVVPETAVFEMFSNLDAIRGENPTTFDFYLKAMNSSGKTKNLYIEVKFTETGFGKAKNDTRHNEKINCLYLPLAGNRKILQPEWLETGKIRDHYQIIRNLIHIDQDSYVIFIYPAGNSKIASEAEIARKSMLAKNFQQHLILQTWEDLITDTASQKEFEQFREHYTEFKSKYFG